MSQEAVYETLKNAEKPLSNAEIYEKMGGSLSKDGINKCLRKMRKWGEVDMQYREVRGRKVFNGMVNSYVNDNALQKVPTYFVVEGGDE